MADKLVEKMEFETDIWKDSLMVLEKVVSEADMSVVEWAAC